MEYRSLSKKTEELLNQQVAMEAKASAIYLGMASWCERNAFEHSAKFFYLQSDEERMHMLKIFNYLNEVGGQAISPEITDIPQDYESLKNLCESFLNHEVSVTQSINALMSHCYQENDFITINFLQWFATEQREEEMTARRILDFFEVAGDEGVALYMIDQSIGNLATSPE
ncbi:ferritin [Persicobacter sp. CCB-QB2]|uniref:ferritin n=1 Tax=Persicobacter sp. CCB-QB2 TaxID=1561025 RepID=UPI0006A9AB7D|nr:ferritin [Persicobacter sp. CCB-QB2]